MQPRLLDGRNLEVILSNVPLPEPDISVPFLSEVRKVPQGDYYRADKVLPLLKQWPVLYEAVKAGHEQAFAEAQNAAAVSAAKDAEIERLRAEVAGLRAFVEHVRRNGSTHLANMAVAVLAARKGEA